MRLVASVIATLALLACAACILPLAAGYKPTVIVSGSMTGAIDQGDLIFVHSVPDESLHAGDIITYIPPAAAKQGNTLLTHRIVSRRVGDDGELVFQTKGDANSVVDPWEFSSQDGEHAKYVARVPGVGYAIGALYLPGVQLGLLGIPAILLALWTVGSVWREAGRAARDARNQETTAS